MNNIVFYHKTLLFAQTTLSITTHNIEIYHEQRWNAVINIDINNYPKQHWHLQLKTLKFAWKILIFGEKDIYISHEHSDVYNTWPKTSNLKKTNTL